MFNKGINHYLLHTTYFYLLIMIMKVNKVTYIEVTLLIYLDYSLIYHPSRVSWAW